MNLTTRVICCAAVLAALLLPGIPVLAQEPAVVRVAPVTLTLAVGGESDVAVEVVGVEGLYGFDARLSFDPAVVEVVDAAPDKEGVQVSLGRMLDPGMAVRDSADNEAGTIHYAMTQINPSEAKSGTGNLIVIRLRGKAAGTTALTITSVDLARRDATAIPASPQPAAVTVRAEAGAQATNTPIPTQAPPTPVPTGPPDPGAAPAAPPQPTATAEIQPTATNPPPASSPTAPAPSATDVPATRAAEVTSAAEALTPPAAPVAVNDVTAPAATPEPASPEVVTATAVPTAQPVVAPVEPEPTPTPQIVAVAPAGGNSGAEPVSGEREAPSSSAPERTLLIIGVIALLAALVIAVILVVMALARRRPSAM